MTLRGQKYKYIGVDILTALLAWLVFYVLRRMQMEYEVFRLQLLIPQYNAKIVFPLIPFFWYFIYWLSGYYDELLFKSRLAEFFNTILTTLLGCILLFFALLINDPVDNYLGYYKALLILCSLQFGLTYFGRLCLTSATQRKINKSNIGYPTVILGTGVRAAELLSQIRDLPKPMGYHLVGCVRMHWDTIQSQAVDTADIVGDEAELSNLVSQFSLRYVLMAADHPDTNQLLDAMRLLYNQGVDIRVMPSQYEFFTGGVRLSTVFGVPLINLTEARMPGWQLHLKRVFDVMVSVTMLLLCAPLFIVLKCVIGPQAIYRQQRVGWHNQLFTIYKFRSMCLDAESDGPQLSSPIDARITPVGKFMRKYRIDELPQFYNVLRGDMSLVGPRPERPCYVKEIVRQAPYYGLFCKVRPGITSWGMVKFGYADTVEKMVKRADYDLLYLENMSVLLDCKIMIHTIKIIFEGRGV